MLLVREPHLAPEGLSLSAGGDPGTDLEKLTASPGVPGLGGASRCDPHRKGLRAQLCFLNGSFKDASKGGWGV